MRAWYTKSSCRNVCLSIDRLPSSLRPRGPCVVSSCVYHKSEVLHEVMLFNRDRKAEKTCSILSALRGTLLKNVNCMVTTLHVMRRYILKITLFAFSVVVSTGLLAQLPSAFSLFDSDSVMHVRLITDIKQLVKDKMDEEYQPAILQILRSPSDTMTLDVEVRSRGNRRKEVCYYPPIRIKFPKQEYSYHKLKWVVSCRDSDLYEQFLLKEFAAYRMFQTLTDKSFRTHLLRIEFVDTGRDNNTFSRYAFVLENADALADRLGGRVYEPVILKEELLNMDHLALMTMFQYMIMNTDWALRNLHNIEIITDRATNSLLAVPYDFDYSGMVNTPYAVPHPDLPIKEVTERYNVGLCLDEEAAEETRQLFMNKRAELEEACQSLPYLTERTKREVQYTLEEFFKDLENKRLVRKIFVQYCKAIH